jgi:hypothetical protein
MRALEEHWCDWMKKIQRRLQPFQQDTLLLPDDSLESNKSAPHLDTFRNSCRHVRFWAIPTICVRGEGVSSNNENAVKSLRARFAKATHLLAA